MSVSALKRLTLDASKSIQFLGVENYIDVIKSLAYSSGVSLFESLTPTDKYEKSPFHHYLRESISNGSGNGYYFPFEGFLSLAESENKSLSVEIMKAPGIQSLFRSEIHRIYSTDNKNLVWWNTEFLRMLPDEFFNDNESPSILHRMASCLATQSTPESLAVLRCLHERGAKLISYLDADCSSIDSKNSPLLSLRSSDKLEYFLELGGDLFDEITTVEENGQKKTQKAFEFFSKNKELKEVVLAILEKTDSSVFQDFGIQKYFEKLKNTYSSNITNYMAVFKDHPSFFEIKDEDGANALMIAMKSPHESFLKKIIAMSDKKSKSLFSGVNNFGATPLHYFWGLTEYKSFASSTFITLLKHTPNFKEDTPGLIISNLMAYTSKSKTKDEGLGPIAYGGDSPKEIKDLVEKGVLSPTLLWNGNSEELSKTASYFISNLDVLRKNKELFKSLFALIPESSFNKSHDFKEMALVFNAYFGNDDKVSDILGRNNKDSLDISPVMKKIIQDNEDFSDSLTIKKVLDFNRLQHDLVSSNPTSLEVRSRL